MKHSDQINNLKTKVESFIGKPYKYLKDATIHVFESVDCNENDCFTIKTDRKVFIKDYSEVQFFIEMFEPMEPMETMSESMHVAHVTVGKKLEQAGKAFDSEGNLKTLASGLMAAFEKVKDNPAYVPQAKAQVEIAETVINLYRVKVEGLRVMSDLINTKE